MSEERDDELDALLARDTPLQRRWRVESDEEPPADVDAAVRAAARRAVGAAPRASHGPSSRWRVPLSIAAVLVVSATVTLMVADRREHLPSAQTRGPAPAAPVEPAPAGVPSAAPARPSTGFVPEPAPLPAPKAMLPEARPESPPPAKRAAEPDLAAPDRAQPLRDEAPPTAAQEAAPAQPQPADETARADAAKAEAATSPASEGDAQALRAREAAAPPAPSAAAPAAGAPAAAVAPRAQRTLDERRERAEEAAGPAAYEEKDGADLQAAPQRWIERIRALRRAGKLDEAAESLREFRKRYPEYPLPSDLEAPR